jgi:mono/diheme cytochrome c family protein
MKKAAYSLTAAFALSLVFFACGGDEKTQHNGDTVTSGKETAADGQTIYEAKCTMCHGSEGSARMMGAADLTTSTLDHAAIVSIVKNGKNSMQPFKDQLTAAEIEAVATYAGSMRK